MSKLHQPTPGSIVRTKQIIRLKFINIKTLFIIVIIIIFTHLYVSNIRKNAESLTSKDPFIMDEQVNISVQQRLESRKLIMQRCGSLFGKWVYTQLTFFVTLIGHSKNFQIER